eukprot:361582-Chlamydomonas_euryale.AAC.6
MAAPATAPAASASAAASLPPAYGPPYDVVVGSDLVYYTYCDATPHSRLLLWTLERVSAPGTLIYLALSLHHNPEEVGVLLDCGAGRVGYGGGASSEGCVVLMTPRVY